MDHAPFIWSAYGISVLVLLWTALAPLVRQKRIHSVVHSMVSGEKSNDPQP